MGSVLDCLRKLATLLNISSPTSLWWLSSPGVPPNSSDCFHSHQCPPACSTRFFGMCVISPAPYIAPSLSMGMSSNATPFHLSPLSPRSRAGNKDWVYLKEVLSGESQCGWEGKSKKRRPQTCSMEPQNVICTIEPLPQETQGFSFHVPVSLDQYGTVGV